MKNRFIKLLLLFFILSLSQINLTNSVFTTQSTVETNRVSVGCWVAPISLILNSPADNTLTNLTNISFNWNTTISTCPTAIIEYNFQIYSDVGLTALVLQSGFSGNLLYTYNNVPEGEYWWHVQVKDQYANTSASTANHVIVDRTKPTSIITTPLNNGSNSIVYTSSWDGIVEGTALDDRSGINHVDMSIYRASDDTYWNGLSWVAGLETIARITTTGTTDWTYLVIDHSTPTIYTITSHAVDNADNVEDSYVLNIVCKEFQSIQASSISIPSVELTVADDKKSVSFSVKNISAFLKLSYELTYESYDQLKGAIGSDIDISEKTDFSKEIDLGTCSNEVCTYDQNVHNLQLEITLEDKDFKQTVLLQSL